VVKSAKRNSISKPIICDSQKHWTNSFHLLARADGRFESVFVKDSSIVTNSIQQVIEQALNEESENILLAKGKGKIGEDEEVLMRGLFPTT
jgi:ribosomal protein S24E